MRKLKCLMKHYREELEDSEKYAKLYAANKHEDHELASIFLDLSKQEHSHAEILSRQIERHIERSGENADSTTMKALWEWVKERGEEEEAETARFLDTH